MRLALFIVISLLIPSLGWADQPASAAVLSLEAENVSAELVETLTGIVRNEALQVEKYQVVNEFPIRLSDVALLIGCSPESATCLKQVAAEVEARIMIYGVVRQLAKGEFQLEINVFDAPNGRLNNRLTKTLHDVDPVVGFRREIESFFAEERGKAMTRLQIGASVEGAQVHIDDALIGAVPIERKGLPAASYRIAVLHPDYQRWEKTVDLVAGADERVWAQLVPLERPVEPVVAAAEVKPEPETFTVEPLRTSEEMPRSPRGTNWGAWSALTVGGVALAGAVGFGIALESVESKLESEAAAGELTEARYQQLFDRGESLELAHRILLGVGVVSAATGIVWLIVDRPRESSASLELSPSGVTARVRW